MVNIVTTYVVEAEDEDDAVDIAVKDFEKDLKTERFKDIFSVDVDLIDD